MYLITYHMLNLKLLIFSYLYSLQAYYSYSDNQKMIEQIANILIKARQPISNESISKFLREVYGLDKAFRK